MTDLDLIIAMLTKAGIEFERVCDDEGREQLTVHAGYIGFFSYISFNKDGSLKSIEAYE